ncbi:MAG: universal stress protein [Anaerolineae bacterium]|nr:universal stress protein [Anaerolineae bacterium]MDW8174010.1 universal stress protein [Anaerolineae bacterium]
MLSHILVPLDGSELSEVALAYARGIVAPGGKITLLSVIDVPTTQAYMLYDIPIMALPSEEKRDEEAFDRLRAQTEKYLRARADALRGEGLNVDTLIFSGVPEDIIIEQAKILDISAIVISTHGRSGFSRWLFGSVTQKIINAMPCPIFVIPGKRALEQERQAQAQPEKYY